MARAVDVAAGHRGETARLVALLDGKSVGAVHQNKAGRLRFVYADDWRESPDAYPLSLSMPLAAREHGHDVVTAFLWGLLPDNSRTLDRYGRLFGVSSANPVALLAHMGADCAGAVQFAPPETLESLLGTARAAADVEWLTDDEIAEELRTVRAHGVPGTDQRTAGRFSLAGAQPKIALLEDAGRWGRPHGRTPTNRILKPPAKDFEHFAENEHLCLNLAGHLRLGSVHSRVLTFAGEVAIVVDRFDRRKDGAVYRRIHQEDACQALAIMPTRKYESEGGPGIRDVVELLRDSSQAPQDDVDRFLRANVLNWVIAATDAHAKNYALLHAPAGATRLAPFYDIASYLPYADSALHRVKLAMQIGSESLVRRIGRPHWQALAKSLRIPERQLLTLVTDVVEATARAVDVARREAIDGGLAEAAVDALADRIRQRAASCLQVLQVSP